MAKSVAKQDKTISSGEITVMVVKNQYGGQNTTQQPQGHEALQTETDNMLATE